MSNLIRALSIIASLWVTTGQGVAQTLKLVGLGGAPVIVTPQQIEALGLTEIRDAREVSAGGTTQRQETTYSGIALPRLLDAFGFDKLDRYAVRSATIMIIAADNYRAAFSWGELFNAPTGGQTALILKIDGQPLPAREGMFSLRAFGDTRPGPRHVREVAEIRIILQP